MAVQPQVLLRSLPIQCCRAQCFHTSSSPLSVSSHPLSLIHCITHLPTPKHFKRTFVSSSLQCQLWPENHGTLNVCCCYFIIKLPSVTFCIKLFIFSITAVGCGVVMQGCTPRRPLRVGDKRVLEQSTSHS